MRITNIPIGEKTSNDFEIKLNGIPAKAYFTRVSAMPFNCIWPGHQRKVEQSEEASFLSFEMDAPVEVELTAARTFEEVVIRPLSDGIKPETCGKHIRFTVEKPGQYTVELDGSHHALHIFANPEQDFGISPDAENVIYFPAGVHHPGKMILESNQTVYIDRDAVVYGSVVAVNAENIRILGYGVLDGSWEVREADTLLLPVDFLRRNPEHDIYSPGVMSGRPVEKSEQKGSVLIHSKAQFMDYLNETKALSTCIHLYNCTNIEINGVILRDPTAFTILEANCQNSVCDNVKIIGWRYNSDGIDLLNCGNCIIRNSFLRDFDDSVVLKGIPGFDTKNMENILVENCVVWCDWGRTLEIGAETCAPEYRSIIFRDCDCIHNSCAVLSIHSSDYARIHDIVYEDIRVEYSKDDLKLVLQKSEDMVFVPEHNVPMLVYAGFSGEVYYSIYHEKGQISDIRYNNIQVFTDPGADFPPIVIDGYGRKHTVRNLTFNGLWHNGKKLTDMNITATNEYYDAVKLVQD